MPKKVFISYAQENPILTYTLLEFSGKLRGSGIDSMIDQYEESPEQGGPIWMHEQIRDADFVLVVSTEGYYKRTQEIFLPKLRLSCEGDRFKQGRGVVFEIKLIYEDLFANTVNNKYIPVIVHDDDKKYIPEILRPYTAYNIMTQFDKLKNRILGVPNVKKPPLFNVWKKLACQNAMKVNLKDLKDSRRAQIYKGK